MLTNRPLEPIMENEVKKNLTSLEKSLYQELANGIIEIKKISQEAIKRKSELLKALRLRSQKNEIHSYHPSFKLLRAIKKGKLMKKNRSSQQSINNGKSQARSHLQKKKKLLRTKVRPHSFFD